MVQSVCTRHPFRIRIYRDMMLDSTVVCRRALGCEWGGQKRRGAGPPESDPGVDWGVLCACRGVVGDVPGLWRGRRHARITQRRHVGELEAELYSLAVGGWFHNLVKRRKNQLRERRAGPGGASARAQPVGATLGSHVVASPASHGARVGGGVESLHLVFSLSL